MRESPKHRARGRGQDSNPRVVSGHTQGPLVRVLCANGETGQRGAGVTPGGGEGSLWLPGVQPESLGPDEGP